MSSGRTDLRADCASCAGLCCVALPFVASADFAITKAAGDPCPNLAPDLRCGIHADLRDRGFRGCTVYDCQGAGQKVVQVTFGGQLAPGDSRPAAAMLEVFPVMRALHELLWYLDAALSLPAAAPVHADVRRLLDETDALTRLPADDLLALDVAAHRRLVDPLLRRAGELARAAATGRRKGRAPSRNADLIGADLRGADLRASDLRGAYLIAADLRGADLRGADVIGADLRDADLRGADLTGCLFLTQAQLDTANGDAATRISPSLTRPAHWPA